MKRTLNLKRIDLWIQLLTVLMILIFSRAYNASDSLLNNYLFYLLGTYIFAVIYQLLSCLLNKFLLRKEWKSGLRRLYEPLLLFVVVVWAADSFFDNDTTHFLHSLDNFCSAYLRPIIALGYIVISWMEIERIKRMKNIPASSTTDGTA